MKWLKYIFGILTITFFIGLCVYFSLDIWGITLFPKEDLYKILIILVILAVTFLLLLIFGNFFFKNNQKGYKKTKEGVARRKE